MATLDAFTADAFSSMSLTAATNMLPYQPMLLGNMNLFRPKRVNTTVVMVDEREGKLSLLSHAARGDTGANTISGANRNARDFRVPHVPQYSEILADDVLNLRAFGSETELETVSALVNERLQDMRNNHEVTHEWHRVGALQGAILDGDGSTQIYDLYSEFNKTEKTVDITYATGSWTQLALDVIRNVEDGMGGSVFTGVMALVGNNYWDKFIQDEEVLDAYQRWQGGRVLFEQQRAIGGANNTVNAFPYQGIFWQNYRGSIGGQAFIPTDEAHFFPLGTTDDTFIEVIAPADFTEAVNTLGQKFYTKQERKKFDKGIDLHMQSNVLYLCTRLDALVTSTGS